jgi:hypothetical protein
VRRRGRTNVEACQEVDLRAGASGRWEPWARGWLRVSQTLRSSSIGLLQGCDGFPNADRPFWASGSSTYVDARDAAARSDGTPPEESGRGCSALLGPRAPGRRYSEQWTRWRAPWKQPDATRRRRARRVAGELASSTRDDAAAGWRREVAHGERGPSRRLGMSAGGEERRELQQTWSCDSRGERSAINGARQTPGAHTCPEGTGRRGDGSNDVLLRPGE